MQPLAVILLSGGLDSATTLAIARQQGFEPCALTFHYGQRHQREVDAARRIVAHYGVRRHTVVDINLRVFGGSALTSDLAVPKREAEEPIGEEIPITYVPARNTIFLAFALAWAEVLPAQHIFIGVNALDYSGYPDCRPEYIEAFQHMARLATKAGVEGHGVSIHAPLLHWTKSQIIEAGLQLGVDYSLTTSCYDPDAKGNACGRCDACRLRERGFAELGLTDPARFGAQDEGGHRSERDP
jgi:7-cyano-7-deazaguanine synthase